jgi:hypothetical protein
MTTYSKNHLSASSGGAAIKVAATSTPGTLIHSTEISSDIIDEIWLYAYNSHTGSIELTIEFGGTTSPDNQIKMSIPSKTGLSLISPGLILSGTGSAARSVRAFAGSGNLITITGFVNRIE